MAARGAQKTQLPANSLQVHRASLSGQQSDACSETPAIELTTLANLGDLRAHAARLPPAHSHNHPDPALPEKAAIPQPRDARHCSGMRAPCSARPSD